MSTISTIEIKKCFNEGELNPLVKKYILEEAINYQWEKDKQNIYINFDTSWKCVYEEKVELFIDTQKLKNILLEHLSSIQNDLYKRNMVLKKINYFNTILKLEKNDNIYKLIVQLNWYAFQINDYSDWNEFVASIKRIKLIHNVKNTRPEKGFKPYTISSKIIFNRNG